MCIFFVCASVELINLLVEVCSNLGGSVEESRGLPIGNAIFNQEDHSCGLRIYNVNRGGVPERQTIRDFASIF